MMNYGASCYSSLNTACHFLIYLIKWVSRKSSGVKTWLNKTKEVSQIQESHSLHSYDIMADLTMFYQNHESKKKEQKHSCQHLVSALDQCSLTLKQFQENCMPRNKNKRKDCNKSARHFPLLEMK